jgi:quinol monooxygenase YgiN
MSGPDASKHLEIKEGDQTLAAAEVTTRDDGETARASLHAQAGHISPGVRASLVDDLMDTPEVRHSRRLEATVPLGDGESLERLRERTDEVDTRPAGSTALFDATIPRPDAAATAAVQETVISTGQAVVTLVNVFTVAPEHQDELVDVLAAASRDIICQQPGFVSANIHRSLDGTRVVNYAQWRSAEDLRAMLASPDCQPHLRQAGALGRSEPALYEVASTHQAPAGLR